MGYITDSKYGVRYTQCSAHQKLASRLQMIVTFGRTSETVVICVVDTLW
jgi:hypothetical protein